MARREWEADVANAENEQRQWEVLLGRQLLQAEERHRFTVADIVGKTNNRRAAAWVVYQNKQQRAKVRASGMGNGEKPAAVTAGSCN